MFSKDILYKVGLGVIFSLAMTSTFSHAATLRYAVGFPSGAPVEAAKKYAEVVKESSNKKHSVKIFEMSLLNHSEMSAGIGEGLADIGFLLYAYSPADYPYSSLGADMSMQTVLQDKFSGSEAYAYSGAMLEYVLLNCSECLDEFKANNQVYTAVVSTPPYVMFCNDSVTTVDDIKGKRIRIAGAPWARLTRSLDASPVALPITETYEALEQGVVDCAFHAATELTNFNFIDVVKNITTDIPGGLYAAGGAATLNRDTWNRFDNVEKEGLLKAGSTMSAYVTYLYHNQAISDLQKAEKAGIAITKSESDLLDRTRDFIEQDLKFVPKFYADQYGIDEERTQELASVMLKLFEKWGALVKDVESADQLAEIYWKEVYSKIDLSTYGK